MDDVIKKAREGKIREGNDEITREDVMKKLSEVIDPELGVDIVSMNLIRDIKIESGNVHIKMTLTIPGCPLMDVIVAEVKYKVSQISGVKNVDVEIVF